MQPEFHISQLYWGSRQRLIEAARQRLLDTEIKFQLYQMEPIRTCTDMDTEDGNIQKRKYAGGQWSRGTVRKKLRRI